MLLPLLLLVGTLTSSSAKEACILHLPSGPKPFDNCLALEGVGSNVNLLWTLEPNGIEVTWGLNSTTDGYIGLGFPLEDSDNVMVGSNALLLQSCDGCNSGAQLRQVYMSGTTSGDMQPSSTIAVDDEEAAETSGGWLVGTFTTPVLTKTPDAYMTILASGAVYKNGDIRMHSKYGEAVINLFNGELLESEEFSKNVSPLVAAHIWLLLIGWGFLAPVGVLSARSLKHRDPLWFQLHRGLMILGLLMGIAGLVLGFAIAGGWNGAFPVHRNLGLASIIMGVAQATALAFRPTFTSKYRRTWNIWHWWQGRAAIVLGVANIYYGLCIIVDTGSWGWAVYTAVFATIVFIAIAKESWEYAQLPPPGVVAHMATDGSRPALFGLELGEVNGGGTNGNTRRK